ncbi:MAG: enoyl-CoA hydratase-related protein [Pseudomonadota bacterium]
MTESLHVSLNDGILEVTLDRPKANAIDAATSRRMGELFMRFRDDPAQRVAILTGAGRFFSAGWDLKAAAEGEGLEEDHGPGGFAGLTQLFDLDKPVIAAVNGLAVGGGFELALCCDLMVAAEEAAFFLPETRVGVAPDAGCFRLPERLPRAIALEMLMTGRRMDAAEAARWGLVNAVVPGDQLGAKARALAQEIVRGAPLAVAAIKELVRGRGSHDLEECYRRQTAGQFPAYARMAASEDAEEGPRAFAEKRDPVWRGR